MAGFRKPAATFLATLFALVAVCVADPASFRPVSLSHRVYAQKPKLNLVGSGFEQYKRTQIHLTLEINGVKLEQFEDYNLDIVSDERLALKLNEDKEWWGTSKAGGSLILKGAVFDATDDEAKSTKEYNIRVATIIPAPTAKANSNLKIMRTQTVRLPINGSGFDSKAKISVFFEPHIEEDKLEVVAHKKSVLLVRLLAGGAWRADEGPLYLKSINTGGGPWKINGDEGIQVATVIKNHGGKVLDSEARLYQSTPKLSIWGEDFQKSTIIRFKSGLQKNTNYTQKFSDLGKNKMRLDLELKKGSKWRAQKGQIIAMSMVKEEGNAALPLNAGKGIVVAEVLEDPVVTESKANLDRTHGDTLLIKGSGFSRSELGATKLTFDPELEMGYDYDLSVKDTKTLQLTLKTGRAWRVDAGPLKVTKVDSGAGDFSVDDVIVATVQDDVQDHESGVRVISSPDQALYQSTPSDKCLKVRGTGFTKDTKITFNSKVSPDSYVQQFVSETELCLKLKSGEQWSDKAEPLKILSMNVGGNKVPIGRSDAGVAVAKIYVNPEINTASDKDTFQSFTKRITIRGSGFDKDFTELAFSPPLTVRDPADPEYGEFEYVDVQPSYIIVGLVNDAKWIRAALEPGDRVPLKVHSVTTTAGVKTFGSSITVAEVTHDPEHVLCDDSCTFSKDDMCDDISSEDQSYNYADDDLYDFDDEYFEPYDFYSFEDDDYGYNFMYDDDYQLYDDDEWYALDGETLVCEWGTDCTDCGPREEVEAPECTNTCQFARDGWCDDERTAMICKLGTDCQDCGPVGASNFTEEDHLNDDAEYWEPFPYLDDDDDMIEWKNDPRANRVAHHGQPSAPGPGTLLVDVLMGLVYFVGAVVMASGLMFLYKIYKGEAIPYHLLSLDPEAPTVADIKLDGYEMSSQNRQY
jgi:hypothetical protein